MSLATGRCALEGCDNLLPEDAASPRPRLYCCPDHRLQARRLRRADRQPEPTQLVDLRRPVPGSAAVLMRSGQRAERGPAGEGSDRHGGGALHSWALSTVRALILAPRQARRGQIAVVLCLSVAAALLGVSVVYVLRPDAVPGTAAATPPAQRWDTVGLHAALQDHYIQALRAMPQVEQEITSLSGWQRSIEAVPAGMRSPAYASALTEVGRRQSALRHNLGVLRKQIGTWNLYVQTRTQYTQTTRSLATVDHAVEALSAVPEDQTPTSVPTAATDLTDRGSTLRHSAQSMGTTIDQLLFTDPTALVALPPTPHLAQVEAETNQWRAKPSGTPT
jgi:hypothetical protein